jgi:hypothetical protein
MTKLTNADLPITMLTRILANQFLLTVAELFVRHPLFWRFAPESKPADAADADTQSDCGSRFLETGSVGTDLRLGARRRLKASCGAM